MCFEASIRTIQRNLKSISYNARLRKRGWIWVWKWLEPSYWIKGVLKSPCFWHKWGIGLNTSSVIVKPTVCSPVIHHGFHAFRSKEEALKDVYTGNLVKLKCRVKDIFAANSKQVVCTKLFLPKSEFDRALKS